MTTVSGDAGGVFACTIVTAGIVGGVTNTVRGVAGATATIAGHCLSFRSLECLCWDAALLGKGSVGSAMEIGVCILPADVTLGLLQPRSNKEDSICAGIVTTGRGAFVEAGG